MGDWDATVPTFTAHQKAPAPSFQILADIASALTGSWSSYTPALTNMTLGSGTRVGRYRRLGRTADIDFAFTLGAGSAVGTSPAFSLPPGFTPVASTHIALGVIGHADLIDAATATYSARVRLTAGGLAEFVAISGTNSPHVGVTATVPFTFGTGDSLVAHIIGLELA